MQAADILVIILSTTLAIFLILAIVLVIVLIGIAKQIKRVTGSAERAVTYVEGAMSSLPKVLGPAMFTKIIAGIIRKMAKGKKQ